MTNGKEKKASESSKSEPGDKPTRGAKSTAGKTEPGGKTESTAKSKPGGKPAPVGKSESGDKPAPGGKSERNDKSPPDKGPGVLRLRIAIVAFAVIAIVLAVVLTSGGDDNGDSGGGEGTRIVTPVELLSTAASSATPIYWAGELPDTQLELSEEANGDFVLRYLEGDAELGSEPAAFLTIGSYPLADPEAELDVVAASPGAIVRESKSGRKVVSNEENPYSVYFASPENSVQVEVYDPSAKRAMDLALSEQVQPAG